MPPKTIPDLIRKPAFIVLLILAIATVLVLVWRPYGHDIQQIRVFAAVVPLNPHPQRLLMQKSTDGIDIRLSGPSSVLEKLETRHLTYPLDLETVAIGVHQLAVDPQRLDLPAGVTVLALEPSKITVGIEKALERAVPVSPSLEGTPRPGWVVGEVKLNPEQVKLKGPAERVAAMQAIKTRPIDLNGMTGMVQRKVVLDVPAGFTATPATGFTIDIDIVEEIATRRYTDLTVVGKNEKYPYVIIPAAITIEARGPLNDLDRLSRENGPAVFVDLNGLEPGVYVRRAVISLPVNTTLVSAAPEVFTVTIKTNP